MMFSPRDSKYPFSRRLLSFCHIRFIACHFFLLRSHCWTERIAREPIMIRTTPLISSTNVMKSKVLAITLEIPAAVISTPIKNITEPK
jgi:hypothetical protein